MPGYIGFRPQFQPISLQEYLTVPTMLQQEFDTYEEKYNENLDKLSTLEAMDDGTVTDITQKLRDRLDRSVDIIAGKSGNLNNLRSEISQARRDFRDVAPRLTNAYTQRQTALKAQQEILLKDPSAVTTNVGSMKDYMNNPNQMFHALSGDKIYADMVNAGKMSAADWTKNNTEKGKGILEGHIIKTTMTGYTPEQQQRYASLVNQSLYSTTPEAREAAKRALENSAEFAQPYQVLSKYIEDNKFGLFDDSQQRYVIDRALSGQLMGMTGSTQEQYLKDEVWAMNQKRAMVAASKKKTENNFPNRTYLPRQMGSTHELNEITTKWNTYKKYFDYDANGNWVLNKSGREALAPAKVQRRGGDAPVRTTKTIPHKDAGFYEFLKSNDLLDINAPVENYGSFSAFGFKNPTNYVQAPQLSQSQIRLNRIASIGNDDYDYTTSDEFYREIDESEFGKVFSTITRLAKEGEVKGSDYIKDEQGNTTFSTGVTSKDLTDLTKKDITGARTVQSSYGTNYLEVDFVDGDRVRIPYSSVAKHSGEVSAGFAQAAKEARAEESTLDAIKLMNMSFDELQRAFITSKTKEYEYDNQKDNSDEELLSIILDE